MGELFTHTFFLHALAGSLLLSIACGLIGSYIVVRRLVFISGGITHASFGGLGLGFYLGVNPIWSAAVFAVLSAFGVEYLSKRQNIREDSAIAVAWSLGMALGIIFIFLTPGYSAGMTEFLFGNILTITESDLMMFGALSGVLIVGFALFHRLICFVAFDAEFAWSQRLPVRWVEYTMMFFIALTIVFSIRLVGIVLLMSMLTIPQIIANLFTATFTRLAWLSVLIGVVGCVAGLLLSYLFNLPSGATIIFVLVIGYVISAIVIRIKK